MIGPTMEHVEGIWSSLDFYTKAVNIKLGELSKKAELCQGGLSILAMFEQTSEKKLKFSVIYQIVPIPPQAQIGGNNRPHRI